MASVQSPAIAVAGHVVRDPAHAVVAYLKQHGGTVTHYDFQAATFSEISPDLIRATRSPWMGSRISAKQAAWFIDPARERQHGEDQQSASAPGGHPWAGSERSTGKRYDATS